MDIAVIKYSGESTGRTIHLDDEVFGVKPNDHAIYLDVKSIQANQRQGTHKAKQRNEISGSSKKIKKQKGTGGARAGNIKNPQFKGGGRVFGPIPRDYSFKLNKKVKDLARKSALTYKAQEKSISVLENFSFEAPKTKQYLAMMNSLSLGDKKVLMVIPEVNKNLVLSGRNVASSKIITASQINTFDVMNADQLVLLEGAVSSIINILK